MCMLVQLQRYNFLNPPANQTKYFFVTSHSKHILEMEFINKYFPHLSPLQKSQFATMLQLYPQWNSRINVVSRKDIDNLETNHLLHSLAIAKFLNFSEGSVVLDFGTGGGFPGIPLAVMFPSVHFILADRTGKKLKVAQEVASACGLGNVEFRHGDVAEIKDKVDFVVSRAVMPQADLIKICRKNISPVNRNALPNGLITLKGGDLEDELRSVRNNSEVIPVNNWFDEGFFKEKKLVYTQI